MKVGIMSMQRIVNLGSYLQSYSLKQMLEEQGCDVEFVDYHVKPCIDNRTHFFKKLIYESKVRVYAFLQRMRGNTVLNKEIISKETISENEKIYLKELERLGVTEQRNLRPKLDLLVIGSDEVFNCLQSNSDVGFSLELFGKRNRAKQLISYAASFGNTTMERLCSYGVDKKIAHCLKRFDAISVRDNNSGHIVRQFTGEEPVYHLDPVLVGNFDSIVQDNVKIDNYIIVYGYSGRFTDEEGEVICEYAKRKGKKIVTLCGKQRFGDEHIVCAPSEVLAYFQHADEVISDTFHGNIFSIITHKPFVAIIRDSVDGAYGNREKLEDMLLRTKMQNRILENIEDLDIIMQQPIDYATTDLIRQRERENAMQFLRQYSVDFKKKTKRGF